MKGIFGASWFPSALLGTLTVIGVGTASVFGWGYSKGYASAEGIYQTQMQMALEDQQKTLLARAEREQKLALKNLEAKYVVTRRVEAVPTPSRELCDIPPECVQWFDDVLEATGTPPTDSGVSDQ